MTASKPTMTGGLGLDSHLYAGMFGSPQMRDIFSDESFIARCLEVEAALARAQERAGLIPAGMGAAITTAANNLAIDWAKAQRETELIGYPILPLVRQLVAACPEEAGKYVHWGATTQDIMDTANALQIRAARVLVQTDLRAVVQRLSQLAADHRDTVMAGRTHGQHALPITFGYKVAVYIAELRRHDERLEQLRPRVELVEFAGAVGTLAAVGEAGLRTQELLAEELGLSVPVICWHTSRDGFGEFIAVVGLLAATLAKFAQEVSLLTRTEIGELEERHSPGRGASSTMPQKRNPITCEAIIGATKLVRQLVPVMLDAMIHDNERATGPWHAEWLVLPQACVLSHGALVRSRELVDGVVVHADRMRTNLDISRGLISSEAVMMALAPRLGRQQAHELVSAMAASAADNGTHLIDELLADPLCADILDRRELERLLDPATYTGLAGTFVDRITGQSDAARRGRRARALPTRAAPD